MCRSSRSGFTAAILFVIVFAVACAHAPNQPPPPRQAHVAADGRPYEVFLPSEARAEPRPLLVMLHGCMQTPQDIAEGTRLDAIAARRRILVVYPEQPATANPARCWNWFLPVNQQRSGEVASLVQIVREVMTRAPVDSTRIYIAGFSAGAAMALNVATAYSDVFAAVFAHAGVPAGAARDVPAAFALMKRGSETMVPLPPGIRAVPALFTQGAADTIVHPGNVRALFAQWREVHSRAGQRLTDREERRRGYIERTLEAHGAIAAKSITIDSLAHAWAGGATGVRYMDPRGPDLTKLMLDFLLEFCICVR